MNNLGLSRKYIVEGLEASLARLQLRYVDIVYAHRPDRLTPMEETVRAFNYVIDQGMALYLGTSEWSADEIAEAVSPPPRDRRQSLRLTSTSFRSVSPGTFG